MTHGSYFHVSWRDIEGNADLTLRLGRTKLQHIPVSWDLDKPPLHHRVERAPTRHRRSQLCSFQKLLPENLDLLFLTFLEHFIPIWLYMIWVTIVIASSLLTYLCWAEITEESLAWAYLPPNPLIYPDQRSYLTTATHSLFQSDLGSNSLGWIQEESHPFLFKERQLS